MSSRLHASHVTPTRLRQWPHELVCPDPDVCRICPTKCCGRITLSVSVVSPSMEQIGRWLYEKCNKCPKIPYSAMVKKMKKWCGIHTRIRIHQQKLMTSRLSPLAHHTCHVCLCLLSFSVQLSSCNSFRDNMVSLPAGQRSLLHDVIGLETCGRVGFSLVYCTVQ